MSICVTVVGGIRWILLVFVFFLWWDLWWQHNNLIWPEPTKCTSHPRLSELQIQRVPKPGLNVFPLFVFSILMTQRFHLTVFTCSTEPLIEHLFSLLSALGGQRSGTARGQPPWSCDTFWILFKGTLVCQTPIDTTLWTRLSNRFRFRKPL